MLILRGEIAKRREKQKSLQLEKDLNSILTKWNWGGQNPKTAQEFLNKFEPWVNDRMKEQKQLEKFMKKWKIKNLNEIKRVELENEEESE